MPKNTEPKNTELKIAELKIAAPKKTRREFAKTLAVMALTPLVSRAGERGEQEPTSARPRPPQTPAPDAPLPETEKLAEFARTRYGKYLSEEQVGEVKRSIDRGLRNAERLKQFKLKNGDEPAFAFSANP